MAAQDFVNASPLLKKSWAVLAALSDADLTKADVAVLGWLYDYADSDTLAAWPTMKTLSNATRMSLRSVKRAVKGLAKSDYVQIISHGNSLRANRYRLTLKGAADMKQHKRDSSVSANTGDALALTGNGDTGVTVMGDMHDPIKGADDVTIRVSPDAHVGATNGHFLVPGLALHSSHDPAQKAGEEEGCEISSRTAPSVGTPPGGAPSSGARGGLVNEWFWTHYPKRRNAAAADDYLTDLLAGGVVRASIEPGVIAYAAYVKAQPWDNDKFISEPINWLKGRRWVDDWTIKTDTKAASKAEKAQKESPDQPKAKQANGQTTNPDAEKSSVSTGVKLVAPPEMTASRAVAPVDPNWIAQTSYTAVEFFGAAFRRTQAGVGRFRGDHLGDSATIDQIGEESEFGDIAYAVAMMEEANLWPMINHLDGVLAALRTKIGIGGPFETYWKTGYLWHVFPDEVHPGLGPAEMSVMEERFARALLTGPAGSDDEYRTFQNACHGFNRCALMMYEAIADYLCDHDFNPDEWYDKRWGKA